MAQLVKFRLPWDPEVIVKGTLNWKSPTHDWCHIKVDTLVNGISLPFSKVKLLADATT